MKELLEGLRQTAQELGAPLLWFALAVLLARALPIRAMLGKIANGQHKNGAPKIDSAGQASVDFWRNEFREMVKEVIDEQDERAKERHESMLFSIRETKTEQSQNAQILRERLHQAISLFSAAVLEAGKTQAEALRDLAKAIREA